MIEILDTLSNFLGIVIISVGIMFGLLLVVLLAKFLYGIIRGTI